MTKSALLGVALLALAACDSAAPAEPGVDDPIVGTWFFDSAIAEELATVSQSQTVLDPRGPITSTVRVTGDETAAFEVLSSLGQSREGVEFSLISYDPEGPSPGRPFSLGITDHSTSRRIELREQTGDYITYSNDGAIEDRMVRDGPTYRFSSVPLVTSGDRRATLSGEVTFTSHTLIAGQPSLLTTYRFGPSLNYHLEYVFEADGQLIVREGEGNASVERSGTWRRTGDRVELRTPVESGTATQVLEFRVVVDGTTLALTDGPSQSGCTSVCLLYYEQSLGLLPGTLLRVEVTQTSRFAREPAVSTQTAQGGAAALPPPAIRERLLLRLSR